MPTSMKGTRGKRKPPAKYDACQTEDEIDSALQNIEPTEHLQCDGKINNVSFHIPQENIDLWKSAVVNYFGEHNTSVLKSSNVIKTKVNADRVEASVKINFYQTGSVVIQGIHCAKFKDKYFKDLSKLVESKTVKTTIKN